MYGAKHPVEDGRMNWSLGGFPTLGYVFRVSPFFCLQHLAFSLTDRWVGLGCSDRCRGDSLLRPTLQSHRPSGPRRSTGRVSPGDDSVV